MMDKKLDNPDHSIDIYSRVDYRRMVAWPARIQREAPFLKRFLERAVDASALDLGCGTGEHSRFLSDLGWRVLGIDRSASMLAAAKEKPLPSTLDFLELDLGDLGTLDVPPFGAAISLGNTLPHLVQKEALGACLSGLSRLLLPGAPFLFQILNYERLFSQGIRWLPVNFRQEEDGRELVFLRLMEPLPDGRVRFCPTTLRYDPAAESPLEVVQSKLVELRGWRLADLTKLLEENGFALKDVFGDMQEGVFEPARSQDLVAIAVRC